MFKQPGIDDVLTVNAVCRSRRIELTDYDDLSQDDPLGYVELRICELQEGVEQSHTLQVQNGAGTLHITTKLKMQKLVRLLVSPKTAVDPATLAPGALEVIDAYGTPHVCLDYIVETPYVSSHVVRLSRPMSMSVVWRRADVVRFVIRSP